MSNLYLGVDASKGYADFVLLDENQLPVTKGFQLDDTATGHAMLRAYLQEVVSAHPDCLISAALESTGGYENNWYRSLAGVSGQIPVRVARLNPAHVNFHSKGNAKRNRTDQISAIDVAEFTATHAAKLRYNEPESNIPLRRMWTYIQLLIKQHTQLVNHLESVIYTNMPELLTYCRYGVPQWLLRVLARYSTYQQLQRGHLVRIPYVSQQKRARLLACIRQGIGQSDAFAGTIISSLATQILALDQQITKAKKQLERQCRDGQPQVTLLQSFKGIGVFSAVGLLVYIGDIARFPSVKKLASYFGLHPVFRKSGDGTWGIHMSKQGAANVRALLYMVAVGAIQHNPVIRELYAHCRSKGMTGNAALGVCMHKILRIVYGMLTHKTPFDPDTHRQHVQRGHAHKPPSVQRREYDPSAPISRRQHKKRKEQTVSQDEKLVTYGINQPAPSLSADVAIVRKLDLRINSTPKSIE